MFAVLTTGGKQYRVEAGSELLIERVPGDAGSSITFDRVLMLGDGDDVTVGTPTVDGATVSGTVIGEALGPKIVVFKFKQKVKYRRRTGHRQHLTRVRIDEILTSGKGRSAKSSSAEASDAKAEPEKPEPKKRATRAASKADATTATEADAPARPKRTRKPAAPKAKAESEE
jgi:large subunit ribosomal protein L21